MWKINLKKFKKDRIKLLLISVLTITWIGTSVLFVSATLSSFEKPYIAYASEGAASQASGEGISVGRDTQKLIARIEETGLYPMPIRDVTRDFFSVTGKIIALDKDNVSVFKYKDSATALPEVSTFQKSAGTRAGSWKKGVHLYAQDNLIVFYMGDRQSIMHSLNSIFKQSVVL